MAKLPTYEEMGKKVAEKALDEIYEGKTLREWIDLLKHQKPCEYYDADNQTCRRSEVPSEEEAER